VINNTKINLRKYTAETEVSIGGKTKTEHISVHLSGSSGRLDNDHEDEWYECDDEDCS